jgi:alpha-tubulin suppressor-like RCC1 family protein
MRRCLLCLTAVLLGLWTASAATANVSRWGAFGGRNYAVRRTPTPLHLPPEAGSIVKVDAGNAAGYMLSSNGSLWSVGQGEEGQLGNGSTKPSQTPVAVRFPPGTTIVAVGEARSSGFAVDSTGQAWSWGRMPKERRGHEGSVSSLCLGQRRTGNVLTPQPIPGLTNVRAVQGGGTHVLWLMADGTVKACGANFFGQLGIGSTTPSSSTTPVAVQGLSNVAEVSAGRATSCALTSNGEVYAWGNDQWGQVGNGEPEEEGEEGEPEEGEQQGSVASPFHVPLPGRASGISCGGNVASNGSTVAIVEGSAYGWGNDEHGQLGDGQTSNKSSPVLASNTAGLNLTQVITSGAYSLGITTTGDVYGWGSNSGFTLAAPQEIVFSMVPRFIDSGVAEVTGTAFDSMDRTGAPEP